jgi:phosphatidylserine decarboxylase
LEKSCTDRLPVPRQTDCQLCARRHAGRSGTDAGFIKFGSRVDLYFPLGTEINVKLNQKAVGGKTIIATKS